MWYEDALGHRGEGPNWRQNLNLLERNQDLINSYFTTTHPDEIKTIINHKKIQYLPIPVDENIENLEIYNLKNRYKDIFFALSHGVNFGKLKRGKKDEREIFLYNLLNAFPKFNYNILGIANEPPKWNYEFMEELSKCKMAPEFGNLGACPKPPHLLSKLEFQCDIALSKILVFTLEFSLLAEFK